MNLNLQKIVEGTTEVYVPWWDGAVSSKMPIFYNPKMEFCRDLSVLVIRHFLDADKCNTKILDGLAGTGIRGIRFANEVRGNIEVVINDRNPLAYELIKKNIKLNKLSNVVAMNKNLNVLLFEDKWDYIDIDPFGSPVKFLDSAIQSIKHNGIIGLTATDTAPLCGTHNKTCQRRYLASSLRTSYSHEIGLRILFGYCVRTSAKYGLGIHPICAYYTEHYFRIYIRFIKGVKYAENSLKRLEYIYHNFRTGERGIIKNFTESKNDVKIGGPLWVGLLFDSNILNMKVDNVNTEKKIMNFLHKWKDEMYMPPFFYTIDELGKLFKSAPMPILTILTLLKNRGYTASRTHFCPSGIKTNAPLHIIKEIFCCTSK